MATIKGYVPHVKGPIATEEYASQALAVVDKAAIEENGDVMVSHGNETLAVAN